jgi:hypothetical protein
MNLNLEAATKMLEQINAKAEAFVDAHYKGGVDSKDRGIKVLATMNQIIELMKQ